MVKMKTHLTPDKERKIGVEQREYTRGEHVFFWSCLILATIFVTLLNLLAN